MNQDPPPPSKFFHKHYNKLTLFSVILTILLFIFSNVNENQLWKLLIRDSANSKWMACNEVLSVYKNLLPREEVDRVALNTIGVCSQMALGLSGEKYINKNDIKFSIEQYDKQIDQSGFKNFEENNKKNAEAVNKIEGVRFSSNFFNIALIITTLTIALVGNTIKEK